MDMAIPYCGPVPVPGAIWSSWNLDPPLLAGLGVLLVWALRQDRRGAAMLGWLALAAAFVSPLCALTTALFSARAVHHLILLEVAAPALALVRPLRGGMPALAAVTAVLVLWHLPPVYALAWEHAAVYWALQAALLLPGWALWSAILSPRHDASGLLMQAVLPGALAAVMGLIGAVLTFAPVPLYPEHHAGPLAWGLGPLADQQLAGLVMWVPGMVPLAALAALAARRGWRRQDAPA